ncbi:TPA: hypothetical protein NOE00_002098 [Pseudomonas aeruginosa]|nr:hypothetical protein [Pseudomonas aeruginosa]
MSSALLIRRTDSGGSDGIVLEHDVRPAATATQRPSMRQLQGGVIGGEDHGQIQQYSAAVLHEWRLRFGLSRIWSRKTEYA